MKHQTLVHMGLLGALALGLAGCNDGGSGGVAVVTPPTPPTVVKLEDNFGANFGTDFRASPNSTPVKPAAGDTIALSLTTPPMALH